MKENSPQQQASLRDYLFILFHRKNFFLIPAFIIFFTATIGSFFLPKYYSSSVLVLMQEEKVINPLSSQRIMANPNTTLMEQLKTLTAKILNYPQLLMVIEGLELDKKIKNTLELEQLILSIRKHTDIRLKSSDVFEVIYEDKDPKLAQQLVNTLVNAFINFNIKTKEAIALTGVKFAQSQAEIYKEKIEESELALYEFRKKYPLQKPGKDTDINVSLLINNQTLLTNTQLALKEGQDQLVRIQNQLSGRVPVELSADQIASDPNIETLNTQLKALQRQLDDTMQIDPASSFILTLKLQIDDLSRRLSEQTQKVIDSYTPETEPLFYRQLEQKSKEMIEQIKSLKRQEKELQKNVDLYEARIDSLPEQDKIYSQLLRDNRVNNNIYEMLSMKVEENRLDAIELQQIGIRYEIIEEGRIPLKPSKPRKLIISVVAFILGILMGLGCVFLVELGDHSFRNTEDACRALSIPVIGSTMKILTLGQLYQLRKKRNKAIAIVMIIFLVFIIIAVVSSYLQEKQLTEKIIREQMQK
ncbi:MAG: GNVR domain-containing protein [Candidatus Omnitrophota bacterium]